MEDSICTFGVDEEISVAGAYGVVAFANRVVGKGGSAHGVCDRGTLAVRRIRDEALICRFIEGTQRLSGCVGISMRNNRYPRVGLLRVQIISLLILQPRRQRVKCIYNPLPWYPIIDNRPVIFHKWPALSGDSVFLIIQKIMKTQISAYCDGCHNGPCVNCHIAFSCLIPRTEQWVSHVAFCLFHTWDHPGHFSICAVQGK